MQPRLNRVKVERESGEWRVGSGECYNIFSSTELVQRVSNCLSACPTFNSIEGGKRQQRRRISIDRSIDECKP